MRLRLKHFVLLKNDNKLLPLEQKGRIALIGPMADARNNMCGMWSMTCTPSRHRTLLEGIRAAAGDKAEILYAKGSNIYYDTENDQLIRASIEKPVYKEKLRLRAYGTPELTDNVFVEIKKKYNGIVNKRRTSITLQEAYYFLDDDICPDSHEGRINRQVLKEIDYFKNFYHLQPKVYLSYDRFAYFEKDDGDFRITFDKNITTRREDIRLEHGSYGKKLLPDGKYLMEVKISGAVPLWFTKIISDLMFTRYRFLSMVLNISSMSLRITQV